MINRMLNFTHAVIGGLLQNRATTRSARHPPFIIRKMSTSRLRESSSPKRYYPPIAGILGTIQPSCSIPGSRHPPSARRAIRGVNAVPSSYQPRTCAASSSDFMAKSEDEAAQVRGWYDDGVAQYGGGNPECHYSPPHRNCPRIQPIAQGTGMLRTENVVPLPRDELE